MSWVIYNLKKKVLKPYFVFRLESDFPFFTPDMEGKSGGHRLQPNCLGVEGCSMHYRPLRPLHFLSVLLPRPHVNIRFILHSGGIFLVVRTQPFYVFLNFTFTFAFEFLWYQFCTLFWIYWGPCVLNYHLSLVICTFFIVVL